MVFFARPWGFTGHQRNPLIFAKERKKKGHSWGHFKGHQRKPLVLQQNWLPSDALAASPSRHWRGRGSAAAAQPGPAGRRWTPCAKSPGSRWLDARSTPKWTPFKWGFVSPNNWLRRFLIEMHGQGMIHGQIMKHQWSLKKTPSSGLQ